MPSRSRHRVGPPTILEWALVMDKDPYLAPEQAAVLIEGFVMRAGGCVRVRTSPVQSISEDGVARTFSGSLYVLGAPCAEYEEAFPNAKQRVIESYNKKGD